MTSASAKPAPFGPDLRAALVAMVRKRVPEAEVEDIVQSALAEAIESPHAPQDSESLRRWIFGVAKNKVVDYHRRAGRESFDMPDVAGAPAPHVEADLLRWAERNIPDGDENQKTLDWMLREGEGEKLESIAASEKLPPPRVRQRVSRLRRHLKENWQREVALLAALGVIVGALVFFLKKDPNDSIVRDVPVGDPRAEPLRKLALEKCASADWTNCTRGLDEAKKLDPEGDKRPEVQKARQAADTALKTAPPPAPSSLNDSNRLNDSTQAPLPTTVPPTPTAPPSGNFFPLPAPDSKEPAPRKQGPTPKSDGTSPPPQVTPLTAPATKDGDTTAPIRKPEGKPAPPSKMSTGSSMDFDSDPLPATKGGGMKKKSGGGKPMASPREPSKSMK